MRSVASPQIWSAGLPPEYDMNHKRFYTLDAMRGVAALAVMGFHIGGIMGGKLFPHAYLAVDFFFMLSGFVLGRAYEGQLRSSLSGWRFLENRLIRLYPLFAFGMLLGAIRATWMVVADSVFAYNPPGAMIAFAMNALMLPALNSPNHLFPFDFPAWSLFFELLINIVFAVCIYRMRSLFLGFGCFAAGALFLGAIFTAGKSDLGSLWATSSFGLLRVGFSFSLGVLMARFHRSASPASPRAIVPVAILGLVLIVDAPAGFAGFYDAAMIFLVMPALLWAGATNQLPERLKIAGGFLGDISYPLYAIHYPLFQAFNNIVIRRLEAPPGIVIGGFVAGVVWLSWFLAHRFDAPVRRWLSGRVRLRPAAMRAGP